MDKNNPGDRVRKYLPFAFDYFSTFQRDFNGMLCFLYHKQPGATGTQFILPAGYCLLMMELLILSCGCIFPNSIKILNRGIFF